MAVFINETDHSLVSGTSSDDSIRNYGSLVSIEAGAGSDYIYNSGDSVTINTGEGDDSIRNYGSNVLVKIGGGNLAVSY